LHGKLDGSEDKSLLQRVIEVVDMSLFILEKSRWGGVFIIRELEKYLKSEEVQQIETCNDIKLE
jgi:hypothetical protein